jgi:hypothetical protein
MSSGLQELRGKYILLKEIEMERSRPQSRKQK